MIDLKNPIVAAIGVGSIGIPVVGPFITGAYVVALVLTDDGTPDAANVSEQDAEIFITQQFGATCNIECKNVMENVSEILENVVVDGDVIISQKCSTNATCVISNNSDMVANVMFAAKNSSNAKESEKAFGSQPKVSNEGRQGIKEHLKQITNEECNITSYNEMRNVTAGAKKSTIHGSLLITQDGNVMGDCQMGNSLKAAAYASGTIDQEAKSEGAEGKKSAKMGMLMWIAFAVAFIAVAFIAGKYLAYKSQSPQPQQQQQISGSGQPQYGMNNRGPQVRTQPLPPTRKNVQYNGNPYGESYINPKFSPPATVNQNKPLPVIPSTNTSVGQLSYSEMNSQLPVKVLP
jgi:hypothetical protein